MQNKFDYIKWVSNIIATRFNIKLFSINLEVTKKCNARCDFCNYWKTKNETALIDFVPVIRHLDPISVVLTGGEPLLRNDICEIIKEVKKNFPLLRLSMISNGILLTEKLAEQLFESGLDQLSLSLDFLDNRHDLNRGRNGLAQHILKTAPLIRSKGMNLCLNTVVMKENLDSLEDIAIWAYEHNINISYSTYSALKNRNKSHLVSAVDLQKTIDIINRLIDLKNSLGNISNSRYYLKNIPVFFQNSEINNCQAGLKWVQVTPEGNIKRCSEHSIRCNWKEYNRNTFAKTKCNACWFGCRGESQAPFQLSRLQKYGKFLINNLTQK